MSQYIWSIATALFEWTPECVNYTHQGLMDHANNVFLGNPHPELEDYHRSPMWEMEERVRHSREIRSSSC